MSGMRRFLVSLAAAVLSVAPAGAYDLPSVNLGFTSFLDGAPPAGPGHYLTEYLQYYSADRLNDAQGKKIAAFKGVDVKVSLTQYVYQSDQPLLGGQWGVNVMLPLVSFDADVLPDNSGLGDLLIGPYVQWAPVMGADGPIFVQRVELQAILPTGDYDRNKALNPGSNHWSFNPYWAATYFATPRATISWRLHYLLNGTNDEPFVGSSAGKVRPGQAIHANLAGEYEILPKQLRVGLNGYVLEQISDSKYDGVSGGSGKEKVLAIGPGLVWHFSQHAHLFANGYVESAAENRPQGERYNLRFVYHF